MDRWGSQYLDDLRLLEDSGLLDDRAAVIADNVLWTGASLFLWHVLAGGAYNTKIVQASELATASEDHMSVSLRSGAAPGIAAAASATGPPPSSSPGAIADSLSAGSSA